MFPVAAADGSEMKVMMKARHSAKDFRRTFNEQRRTLQNKMFRFPRRIIIEFQKNRIYTSECN